MFQPTRTTWLRESVWLIVSIPTLSFAQVTESFTCLDSAPLQSQLQFGSVPGYVGDEFSNARFGVHDDLPYMKFDDIFPPQATVELGLYPVSTGTGTGYFDYTAEIHFSDKESKTVPYYQRYMLELQKGLGSNTVLSLSYLGGRGSQAA